MPTSAAPNADPDELDRFEQVAHRWWDAGGEFRALHDLNPLRLDWIAERAALDGARALDVGCGGGLLTEAMATSGAQALGIDLGASALQVARLHALDQGLDEARLAYLEVTVEDHAAALPAAQRYDVVTCMEMLEHVPDPGSVIRACAAAARPGANLFFSTINRNPKSYLLAVLAAEYALNLVPRGTHDYARFIKPAELADLLRRAGLVVRAISGVTYNPLTRRANLSRDVDVNYMVHAIKPAAGQPGDAGD